MIYLDNAATSWPKPEEVYRTMDDFARRLGANPGRAGHRMAVEAETVLLETRNALAKFIGAESPARVAFALNATDALNMAIKGVLRPGDHAVTSSLEHNSVVRPLEGLAKRTGVTVTRVPCGASGVTDPEEVRKALRPNTRLIAFTHASNVTGALQPVREIGRIARERGVLFLVDAAQTIGVYPVDVKADLIDLLAFPGHKALYGPTGTGGLYVREGIAPAFFREGGTGRHSEQETHAEEMPLRLEGGTPNTVGLAGLGAGLRFINKITRERIFEHELILAERFRQGLRENRKITIHGPPEPQHQLATISFRIEGYEPDEAGAVLDQSFEIACRTGLHCAPAAHRTMGTLPAGTVRCSFGYFNTTEHVDAALKALGEMTA